MGRQWSSLWNFHSILVCDFIFLCKVLHVKEHQSVVKVKCDKVKISSALWLANLWAQFAICRCLFEFESFEILIDVLCNSSIDVNFARSLQEISEYYGENEGDISVITWSMRQRSGNNLQTILSCAWTCQIWGNIVENAWRKQNEKFHRAWKSLTKALAFIGVGEFLQNFSSKEGVDNYLWNRNLWWLFPVNRKINFHLKY